MNFKSKLKSRGKDAIFLFLRLANPRLHSGASLLMYHSIGTNQAFFTVSPYQFERQLIYLLEHDYKIIKLSEFIGKLARGEDIANTICLTFDDGYRDNYTGAFPIIKKYDVPATIFIATGLIGENTTNSEGISLPIMNESQMREMQGSGLVEFMPHTHTHAILNTIPVDKAREEISRSQDFLEEMFDTTPDIFAFPKGVSTKETVAFLKTRGFKAAVTVNEGLVHQGDDLFLLKRNSVDSSVSFTQFKGKVSIIDQYQKLKGNSKKEGSKDQA